MNDHETDGIDADDIAHDAVQVSTTSRHHSIVDVSANSSQQENCVMKNSGTANVQKVNAVESIVHGIDPSDSDNDGAQVGTTSSLHSIVNMYTNSSN